MTSGPIRSGHSPSGRPRTTSSHWGVFVRQAARDRVTVGAVAPSSRFLAQELVRPLADAAQRPVRVLEVGAGTGVVTAALTASLGPDSRLDVVEINPVFGVRLQDQMQHLTASTPAPPDLHLYITDIRQLPAEAQYDHIVSGLPFANFDPRLVAQILDHYTALLRPGGTVSYFAYAGTRRIRRLLSSAAEHRRHQAAERVLRSYRDGYQASKAVVCRNLPPARVWHLTDRRDQP